MARVNRKRGDAIDAAADDDATQPEPTGNYPTAHKAYTAAGWRGILPLPPQSKMPPPKGCTGADGRWPSAADALDWKLHSPPDCNIALRLPPDVIGLDVDQYGNKSGFDTLLRARMQHRLPELPPTWRTSARESNESGIYLYRVPEGTRLRGEAVPDVETIQHHHRFALVWPSIHPKGAMPYRWRSPEGPTSTTVPRVDELPELAGDWIDFLADRLPTALPADLPPPVEHRETTWHPTVHDAYHKARAQLLVAEAGSRHEIARDRCMALCRMEQDGLAGATAAIDALGAVFVDAVRLERGTAGEAHSEWLRMRDGGRQLAQTTVTAAQVAREAERADIEALLPPGPAEGATEAHSDPYGEARVDWPTFWRRERVDDQYLIEPLLARGRGHAIYASAKVGKSLLMLEVAAACATGQASLDSPAADPVNVVYLDMEMTEDDIRDRLVDLGYGPTDDLSHLHYYLLPSLPPLDTDIGGAALEAIAVNRNAELVVIDTMARVIEGEENSADTFKSFYRYTGSRLKRRGITYARLDHAGKDIEKGQRGSSAKVDDVDIVWRITSTEGGVRLKATHRRIKTVPENLNLRRDSDPLRHTIIGGSYAPGTRELAARLDALHLPLDTGRDKVRAALKEAGVTASTDVLASAIRFRKENVEWVH